MLAGKQQDETCRIAPKLVLVSWKEILTWTKRKPFLYEPHDMEKVKKGLASDP